MITFKQGDDVIVQCLIMDGVTPVDISAALEIRAVIFVDQAEVMRLSLVPTPNYGVAVIPTVTDKNEVDLLIDREYSKMFPVGAVTAYVDIFMPDATFDPKHTEYMFEVGTVEEGKLKNEVVIPTDPVTVAQFSTQASTRSGSADNISYTTTANHATSLSYKIDALSEAGGNSINAETGEVSYDAAWTGTTIVMAIAEGWQGPVFAYHVVTTT